MNRNSRRNLLWIALSAALVSAPVQAARLVYSGVLEVDGQPANGRHDLKLTAYPSADGAVPKAAPIEFYGVEVKDGRFEVALDLPGEAKEAWVDLAVRPTGAGAYIPLLGRSKAVLAPEAIGQCWSTTGDAGSNPATNFIGTTDAQPFVVRTQNARSLRIEPSAELFGGLPITTNTIAGSRANSVTAGVRGATIAGGGVLEDRDPTFGFANPNRVTDHYGTVSGGFGNRAGDAAGTTADRSFATVGGGRDNTASGGNSTVGGGTYNAAIGVGSTVGGGDENTASGGGSTVGGGTLNTASGVASTVGGGIDNTASGSRSTVGGGERNCAGGSFSWAGGFRAKVRPAGDPGSGPCSGLAPYPGGDGHQGTFVWADSQAADFVSTGPDQFLIRADGGLLFNTNTRVSNFDDVVFRARQNSGDADIDLRLVTRNGKRMWMWVSDSSGTLFITPQNLNAGADRLIVTGGTGGEAFLTNGGAWTNASSRSFKEGFAAVDTLDVLNRLLALPITTWQYIGSSEGLHMGPVAEDFKAAFGLAGDGKTIATVDADGVALAAIQGLNAKLEAENAALRAESAELRARLQRLEALVVGRSGDDEH
jgi:hypothetical protein